MDQGGSGGRHCPPPKRGSLFMHWPACIEQGSRLIVKVWPPTIRVACVAGRLTALRRAAGLRWATTTLLLFALTAQAALAQQASRIPRIGILSPYAVSASSFHDDVKRGLTDLGYVERATVVYETRFADGRTDRLPALAADLVHLKVDVIVTTTAPAV